MKQITCGILLLFGSPFLALAATPEPDRADVTYGDHPRNKLDLWLVTSEQPAPLVIFIHGGGFVGGDKSSLRPDVVTQCREVGVAVAAINYRFRTEASINTVLRDSARAVQFLRHHAEKYGLDKSRFAAFGGSAGAGTSLWLAFHDDLADPKADDPVLRESTRLTAAGSTAGQATYDITRWAEVLGSDTIGRFHNESAWPAFYGLETLDDLQSDEGKRLRADADMLGLISRDDPPVWLGASGGIKTLDTKGDVNHSPKHSEAVKRRCDEIGVPCELNIITAGQSRGGPVEFLLSKLKPAPATR